MKKFLSLMIIGIVAMMAWSCDDDDDKEAAITFDQLPKAAQTFINQYYAGDNVVYIDREGKNERTSYDVHLKSGTEIEFDATGEWTDVDAPAQQYVPDAIVPDAIKQYVTTNFPAFGINEISKRRDGGYEIELTNGLDLQFDKYGVFVGHLD